MHSLEVVQTASPMQTVVETVAAREDVGPTDLTPLYEAIDPEALDSLVGGNGDNAVDRIEFAYCGYVVTVDGDGRVDVEERE